MWGLARSRLCVRHCGSEQKNEELVMVSGHQSLLWSPQQRAAGTVVFVRFSLVSVRTLWVRSLLPYCRHKTTFIDAFNCCQHFFNDSFFSLSLFHRDSVNHPSSFRRLIRMNVQKLAKTRHHNYCSIDAVSSYIQ